ncbi:fungal-specific transcription factor domain-containing protein [Xylariales sp. PMI_506]|nr:fungal-specific transcription factor domain-containing protein [Xylariales sp. PMI_506]
MPGILPMKVIKVGSSSQSRIAQACDRCRSKKIRCDGIRPCCTQCANVGFECRTSDKLSRRAFPRGYTESLEERVRALETEVRELKDLLDEKDEKIDMLSKMHSHQLRQPSIGSVPSPPVSEPKGGDSPSSMREDTFRVQASPLLLGVENSDSYFMGPSSGRSFIETFKRKMQESGKSCSDFNPEAFLHIQGCYPLVAESPSSATTIPPRLFSDRCVNVYFQEWAPLFPVLHKPTFLRTYEEFVSDAEKMKSPYKTAQLYLVFGIAALSSERPDVEQIAACEANWQKALDSILMENTMNTLQCLILALMYCSIRADYKRLIHYKGVAVALSHRLGLHQSQKRFSFGALTIETRKKVFWTLYTLDCFSAAMLGLPKVLNEDDIHAEYPSDCDDEYVTEKGFQPTLPGEHTRLSSALALFKISRILAKVLEKNYPAATSHDLSLQQILALDLEASEWNENLPGHLKLHFAQGKPSTDVTGSRSPILALVYYYTRILIHRPAVGSSLGAKAAPCLFAVGEASKHIIQVNQLLEERSMAFSFCLNRTDVLDLCAITLLYQTMDLKHDSKIVKDGERLVNAVLKTLLKARAPGTYDLIKVASMLISVDEQTAPRLKASASPEPALLAPPPKPAQVSAKKPAYALGRHAAANASETNLATQQERIRRMTMPQSSSVRPSPELYRSTSRASFDDSVHRPTLSPESHHFSIPGASQTAFMTSTNRAQQNLDYLSLNSTPAASQPSSPAQTRLASLQNVAHSVHDLPSPYSTAPLTNKGGAAAGMSASEWEALLGSLDGGQINLYDAIYGGPSISLETSVPLGQNFDSWAPNSWEITGFNLEDLKVADSAPPQSVLSFSDDSLSSSEDLGSAGDLYLNVQGDDLRTRLVHPNRTRNDPESILDNLTLSLGI